ncbi:MAG: hypothetical protein U1F29_10815 [Planctomycetota bacterium]
MLTTTSVAPAGTSTLPPDATPWLVEPTGLPLASRNDTSIASPVAFVILTLRVEES